MLVLPGRVTSWSLLAVAAAGLTGLGLAQTMISVRPGLISYAEGQVRLAGVGAEPSGRDIHLGEGQHILTDNGRVEVLLTPGTILRAGGESQWEMISAHTQNVGMRLHRGAGIIEVKNDLDDTPVSLRWGNAFVYLSRKGVYRLDVVPGSGAVLEVRKGKARVAVNGAEHEVKAKRSIALGRSPAEIARLSSQQPDELDTWHEQRTSLIVQAAKTAPRSSRAEAHPQSNGGAMGGYGTGPIQCENGLPELLN